tara:strand:- start:20213 stop:21808 length:1596 start_codon:yes stop_codon:yes gene_type:complete
MAVNEEIFLGSGASLTLVPEVDLYIKKTTATGIVSAITLHTDMSGTVLLVPNIYVGCTIDRYVLSGNVLTSSHTITSNTTSVINFTPATAATAADDYFIIRSYGAPCVGAKSGTTARLNADNWLGLVESASFPNVEQEMKQLNLQLGGSRNFSHQYKGIRTASGGNVALVANHGAWLYYALGACDNVVCTITNQAPASVWAAASANHVYIDSNNTVSGSQPQTISTHVNTGPIFYRTAKDSTCLLPPVLIGSDAVANLDLLTRTTSNATSVTSDITYRFIELNSADLPSFALEQSIAKDPTTLTTQGAVLESNTFVRIARGNRVNTLTLTANENEEVKMTMDLNTSAVTSINTHTTTDLYEARSGISTNTNLFNYAPNTDAELLEPFFFSKGSLSIFGQTFLKITNFSLTINNNLTDKRFIGVGSKDVKHAIPAQRSYEISFTALVTDDKLFEELFNETENNSTVPSGSGIISLQFDKDNTEQIAISLTDYHLDGATWTIPDDKGPITVEATVKPRSLNECTVKTHWVLQG